MIKCKLKRIKSNHNEMGTDEISGYTTRLPILSEPFTIFRREINAAGGLNYYRTTKVLKIDTLKNVYTFTTRNSVYELTISVEKES